MKLDEIFKNEPKFAWFEPAENAQGMKGVRLAFVEPTMPRFRAQIIDAAKKKDKNRKERVELKMKNYQRQGLTDFPRAPDLGWWLTKSDFERGENNEDGFTKGNIYQNHPDLEIYPSRKDAVNAARKAGVI